MKERITLTIDADLLKKIDSSIDGYKIKNRSHAVELLLMNSMGDRKIKTALILAGGRNNEAKSVTKVPKVMIPVHGKPILEHLIELFRKNGITNIILSIGYKGKLIKEYFGSGKKFGVNINYIEEEHPLGTAGPLRLARPFLTETFIMCNGDELKDIDIKDMFNYHKENKALITIALTTVDNPATYGIAVMNGNRVLDFIEKPSKAQMVSNLINAGLYIMEPEVIDYVPDGFSRLENDVFPKLCKEDQVLGYPFSGQWFDITTPQSLRVTEKGWKGVY